MTDAAPAGIRVVHVNKAPCDLYIGRANRWKRLQASRWQNPYRIGPDGTRDEVLAKFRAWICGQPDLLAALPTLRGKTLGCWCAPRGGVGPEDPLICHGQILARLAEGMEG